MAISNALEYIKQSIGDKSFHVYRQCRLLGVHGFPSNPGLIPELLGEDTVAALIHNEIAA